MGCVSSSAAIPEIPVQNEENKPEIIESFQFWLNNLEIQDDEDDCTKQLKKLPTPQQKTENIKTNYKPKPKIKLPYSAHPANELLLKLVAVDCL